MTAQIQVGALALAMAVAFGNPASANLVENGSFETGFTGWTQTGNTGFTGVVCSGGAADGNCFAYAGPTTTDGGFSQSLSTVTGQDYAISFFLSTDGGVPSDFSAYFGGTQLLSLIDPPAMGFTEYSFVEMADAASTTVAFNFRDDPGFVFLDAISVVAAPEPITLAVFSAGLVGAVTMRRRKANRGRQFSLRANA